MESRRRSRAAEVSSKDMIITVFNLSIQGVSCEPGAPAEPGNWPTGRRTATGLDSLLVAVFASTGDARSLCPVGGAAPGAGGPANVGLAMPGRDSGLGISDLCGVPGMGTGS